MKEQGCALMSVRVIMRWVVVQNQSGVLYVQAHGGFTQVTCAFFACRRIRENPWGVPLLLTKGFIYTIACTVGWFCLFFTLGFFSAASKIHSNKPEDALEEAARGFLRGRWSLRTAQPGVGACPSFSNE